MGFFSGIRRRIKKIIPKEIRPALPFIASAYFGPSTGGLGNLFTREGAKLLAIKNKLTFLNIYPLKDKIVIDSLNLECCGEPFPA